jgi:FlaA1/EpsC-like NDP-sugar epimerase
MTARIFCTLVVLGIFSTCNSGAQGFINPVENPISKECYITLVDSVEFKCELRSYSGSGIKTLTIRDETGAKHKLKAHQVERMRIKMSDLAKIATIVDGSESVGEAMNLEIDEIIEREYIYFEQALLPKKKDKYVLLQLLNPGFDGRIKVFEDTQDNKSGMSVGGLQVTGGEERSYLVVKDGEKSMRVKKGSYKKDFSELFNDCTDLLNEFSKYKIKFKDMGYHVLYYNSNCKLAAEK